MAKHHTEPTISIYYDLNVDKYRFVIRYNWIEALISTKYGPKDFSIDPSSPMDVETEYVHHQGNAAVALYADEIGTFEGVQLISQAIVRAYEEANGFAPSKTQYSWVWHQMESGMWEHHAMSLNPDGHDVFAAGGYIESQPIKTTSSNWKYIVDKSGGYQAGNKSNNYFVNFDQDIYIPGPVDSLRNACAGLKSKVDYPLGTQNAGNRASLDTVIMYLNDNEQWSRERIADWLESLDVDLTVDMEKI